MTYCGLLIKLQDASVMSPRTSVQTPLHPPSIVTGNNRHAIRVKAENLAGALG